MANIAQTLQVELHGNPWEPYRILFYPRLINGRWYLPGDTVYRRWVLSPGGGYWQWGDDFDRLKWTETCR